jgi:hypothetical protein
LGIDDDNGAPRTGVHTRTAIELKAKTQSPFHHPTLECLQYGRAAPPLTATARIFRGTRVLTDKQVDSWFSHNAIL